MKRSSGLWFLFLLPFCCACANYHVAGDVAKGRHALMLGQPQEALAHFRSAAEQNPDYYLNYSILNQGIWTYVGKAYYALGDWQAARTALEKARSRYDWDNMARVYLGLVLVRANDRERGLREIDAGLKGLHDWLDYVSMNYGEGRYWDPGGEIRKRIDNIRAMIHGRDADLSSIIASTESVALSLEKEIDRSKRQERRARRDSSRRDGRGK